MLKNQTCCENCLFFEPMPIQKRDDSKIGTCHANPPSFKYALGSQPEALAQFPVVISSMWCGFFQGEKN